MSNRRFVIKAFALLALPLIFTSAARADGARSYVSTSGSDSKQCTRANPCRSFDAALAKTDAGGEVIALDTGTYPATTVTKSVTLAAAPGAEVGITVAAGNAVTVNAAGHATVVLRGLTLTGPGAGVAHTRGVEIIATASNPGPRVHVERCVISNFERGLNLDAEVAAALFVSDSAVRNNHHGIHIRAFGVEDNGASVSNSRIERNGVGVVARPGASVTVYDSVAAGNAVGFEVYGSLDISHCAVTKNQSGVWSRSGRTHIASSTFTGNRFGVDMDGGQVASMGNNMFAHNELDVVNVANGFTTFSAT